MGNYFIYIAILIGVVLGISAVLVTFGFVGPRSSKSPTVELSEVTSNSSESEDRTETQLNFNSSSSVRPLQPQISLTSTLLWLGICLINCMYLVLGIGGRFRGMKLVSYGFKLAYPLWVWTFSSLLSLLFFIGHPIIRN